MSEVSIFGEINSDNLDSKYTWANGVTLTLLKQIHEYGGFEHVKESDIVNAGLVFLNLFFNIHVNNDCKEKNEGTILEITFDEKEFVYFLNMAISHGRMHNIMLNDEILFAGDKHEQ